MNVVTADSSPDGIGGEQEPAAAAAPVDGVGCGRPRRRPSVERGGRRSRLATRARIAGIARDAATARSTTSSP